jgi:catechol 2,3-dioxygenase-like lactoylglutathione lyase family enzyme
MKIKVTGVYVDDQDKALRFYTNDACGNLIQLTQLARYSR